jgi:hypothetical protein
MPRPIFNVVLMLNNDFAAVRSDCLADHVFTSLAISENGLPAGSFRLRGVCQITQAALGGPSAWQLFWPPVIFKT